MSLGNTNMHGAVSDSRHAMATYRPLGYLSNEPSPVLSAPPASVPAVSVEHLSRRDTGFAVPARLQVPSTVLSNRMTGVAVPPASAPATLGVSPTPLYRETLFAQMHGRPMAPSNAARENLILFPYDAISAVGRASAAAGLNSHREHNINPMLNNNNNMNNNSSSNNGNSSGGGVLNNGSSNLSSWSSAFFSHRSGNRPVSPPRHGVALRQAQFSSRPAHTSMQLHSPSHIPSPAHYTHIQQQHIQEKMSVPRREMTATSTTAATTTATSAAAVAAAVSAATRHLDPNSAMSNPFCRVTSPARAAAAAAVAATLPPPHAFSAPSRLLTGENSNGTGGNAPYVVPPFMRSHSVQQSVLQTPRQVHVQQVQQRQSPPHREFTQNGGDTNSAVLNSAVSEPPAETLPAGRIRLRQEAMFWQLFDRLAFHPERHTSGRGASREFTASPNNHPAMPVSAVSAVSAATVVNNNNNNNNNNSNPSIATAAHVVSPTTTAAATAVFTSRRAEQTVVTRERFSRNVVPFRAPAGRTVMHARSETPPPPPAYVQSSWESWSPRRAVAGPRGALLSDGYAFEAAMAPDVDQMTYEELLELAERIGRVKRGVARERLLELRIVLQPFHFDASTPVKRRLESSRAALQEAAAESNERTQSDEQSGLSCCVCLDSFEVGDTTTQLPCCRHFLHENCASRWFESEFRCPICTRDVRGVS